MTYKPDRLPKLATRLHKLEAELLEIKVELPDAVQEAITNGVRQVDVMKLLGMSREQVRRLGLPEAQREDLNARRRRRT